MDPGGLTSEAVPGREPGAHSTSPAPTVIVRPVRPEDASALAALAGMLDTVNLPNDPQAIARLIADSQQSFDGASQAHASYTLVAVDRGDGRDRLLGTGSIFAYHGMPEDPHYYLSVVDHTVHSRQLNADRSRRLLRLGRDIEPWSELGALVVDPAARGQGIGKLLVAARLLLVAMHPQRFCRRLLAELLPPRRKDGSNAFWDAVGAPLTGLNYYRADLLCRSDKEFIDAFFPHEEIVVDLLPAEARTLIGQEGPATTPVRKILQRAGFHFLGTIDPFDGGPHDGAEVSAIGPIQRSRELVVLDLPPAAAPTLALVGDPAKACFHQAHIEIHGHGLRLDRGTVGLLGLQVGDRAWAMPLDW